MKNNAGFTLMELMTVIAIIGILSAIAVPNMIAWRNGQQLNSSAREVMSFINGARMEAVKNNATVNISIDATNRIISSEYTNRADDKLPPVEKEILIRPGITIDSTTFTGNPFSFNSRGIPFNFGTVNANESPSITLKKSDGDTRSVVMEITGVTRIE